MQNIPTHPLAWLTSKDISHLTGYSLRTIQRRWAIWQAKGLKVLTTKIGHKKIQLKEWERFIDQAQKKGIDI